MTGQPGLFSNECRGGTIRDFFTRCQAARVLDQPVGKAGVLCCIRAADNLIGGESLAHVEEESLLSLGQKLEGAGGFAVEQTAHGRIGAGE